MATHTKRKSTARSRGKRRAKDARSDATRRLPDGAFDPDAEVSIWRGITETEITKKDTVRVLLTQDTIRQAVRRLVRLAATWEATSGFKGMLPQLQEHNVRVLENVVALLDVHDREAPILFVDGFRITRADQELVILHAMVAAELEDYGRRGDADGAIDRLAWTLGNSFRVPREQIERAWNALAARSPNWVKARRGASEAAKLLLGKLMSITGGTRIATLKRLTTSAKAGRAFSSSVQNIFEQLENKAWANNRHRCDLLGYATAVLK
jgi:hypothetical protein